MKVLLVAGGWSTERSVSLDGAAIIEKALLELGHAVTRFDLRDDYRRILAEASTHDFAFLNLHGAPGEDGSVQALLDTVGCPYQGTGPAGSFLALDKAASKLIFERKGLPTPRWELITKAGTDSLSEDLRFPVFVKPNTGGSSLGTARITRPGALKPALDMIFALGEEALAEEMIEGEEVTCSVLDGNPLPLILIRPAGKAEFFDYDAKYQPGGAEEICPAPIDEKLAQEIRNISVQAYNALGLNGYGRADFIVADGKPWLLEVNTLPGMTATSLLPKAAAEAGLSFAELIAELIRLGLEEAGRRTA